MDSLHQARIMVEEKKYWRMRMGIRYDEFHLGEGFIQPAYENLLGLGIVTAIHLQYGLRREKYAIDFQGNHLLTPNFANNLQIQFYISKERIFQREIFKRTIPSPFREEFKENRNTDDGWDTNREMGTSLWRIPDREI